MTGRAVMSACTALVGRCSTVSAGVTTNGSSMEAEH